VIGVGYLGRFHAEKYAAHPGAELIAVAGSKVEMLSSATRSSSSISFQIATCAGEQNGCDWTKNTPSMAMCRPPFHQL
jgi:hypothetical protein